MSGQESAKEILRGFQPLLDYVIKNPDVAREVFSLKPPGEELRWVFSLLVEPLKREASHLPKFFQRYLGEITSNAILLFLGSGSGSELLHARDAFPEAQIVAIDKEVTGASVLTEVASGAKFHKIDLSTATTDDVLRKIGKIPDVVIARHPDVVQNPWWTTSLLEWGNLMRNSNGKLVVSTITFYELSLVGGPMVYLRMNPSMTEYLGGLKMLRAELQRDGQPIQGQAYEDNVSMSQDGFVIEVR